MRGPTFPGFSRREVAAYFGVSKTRIEQIEKQAIRKVLRELLKPEFRDLRHEFTTDEKIKAKIREMRDDMWWMR